MASSAGLPGWLRAWPPNLCYCDYPFSENAYEKAAKMGDIEAFRHLQQHQRNPNCPGCAGAVTALTLYRGESLVYLAAKAGHPAFLDYVLTNGALGLIDVKQGDGKTPIWASIFRAESLPTFKVLLVNDASLRGFVYFSPFDELRVLNSEINRKEFLLPLYQWLVKLKKKEEDEHPVGDDLASMSPETFLEPVSNIQRVILTVVWSTNCVTPCFSLPKTVLPHVSDFLTVKECATLQLVSTDMRKLARHRLSKYGILKGMLEIYHPWVKTGEVPVEEDDEMETLDGVAAAAEARNWLEQRARRNAERKEYARRHMSSDTFSLIYEL